MFEHFRIIFRLRLGTELRTGETGFLFTDYLRRCLYKCTIKLLTVPWTLYAVLLVIMWLNAIRYFFYQFNEYSIGSLPGFFLIAAFGLFNNIFGTTLAAITVTNFNAVMRWERAYVNSNPDSHVQDLISVKSFSSVLHV